MTTNASRHGALSYSAEGSFGENQSSVGTRLLTRTMIDLSGLTHEKIESPHTHQHLNDHTQDHPGTQGGSFSVDLDLSGLGSTAAGSITANHLAVLIAHAIGAVNDDSAGTTIDGSSTATSLDLAGGTFPDGVILRVGALKDGRANGQAAVVDEVATGTAALLTALPAAPNAADVVYAMAMVHPYESHDETGGTGLRFLLQTANQSVLCHGCYATEIAFAGLSNGQLPRVTITYAVSWWEHVAVPLPTALETAAFDPAPVAAGSVFFNEVGTATRATLPVREFELAINLETVELPGPEGHDQWQRVVGYRRIRCQATITMQVDAEANTASPVWSGRWLDNSKEWHLLATLSAVNGRALALYMPRLQLVGNRPTQADREGLNVVPIQLRAVTGPDDESELTLSNFRIGIG